jgi:hypothetical protein
VKVVGYWWGKPNFEEEKKQVDRYFYQFFAYEFL